MSSFCLCSSNCFRCSSNRFFFNFFIKQEHHFPACMHLAWAQSPTKALSQISRPGSLAASRVQNQHWKKTKPVQQTREMRTNRNASTRGQHRPLIVTASTRANPPTISSRRSANALPEKIEKNPTNKKSQTFKMFLDYYISLWKLVKNIVLR